MREAVVLTGADLRSMSYAERRQLVGQRHGDFVLASFCDMRGQVPTYFFGKVSQPPVAEWVPANGPSSDVGKILAINTGGKVIYYVQNDVPPRQLSGNIPLLLTAQHKLQLEALRFSEEIEKMVASSEDQKGLKQTIECYYRTLVSLSHKLT